MELDFANVDVMPQANQNAFWNAVEFQLSQDDGRAAREHLEAGQPIYYCEDQFPSEIIRHWPSGKRDLGIVNETGQFKVVRAL